jgi:hypothetical protein
MTGRSRLHFFCLPAALLCAINFAISPEVYAKSDKERGSSNGKAWGKQKDTQESSPEQENSPPTLSGTPDDVALENSFYEFQPDASDPDGDSLTFSIANHPGWADFDPTTGALYGTPTQADAGRYSAIKISVSDGVATAELPSFAIDVTSTALASVTLHWQPPTENTDGTPLSDLAGYRIYYGLDSADMSNVIEVANPGLTSYVVETLAPNTWYFAMTALNSQGMESPFSDQLISATE